jgi:photosystem II stability/assembly factor-like uncharacterized protein
MKNRTLFFLLLFFSFTASAQLFTFEWEEQVINEGYNMKGMNIVNDTTTILVGYGKTFEVSKDLGQTWSHVPILTPEFDFADISINSAGVGYACAGDEKVIDNPSSGEPDVYADGVLLKTLDNGATWFVVDITEIGTGQIHTDYPNTDGCYAKHFRSVEVLEDNSVFLSMEWYFHESETNKKLSFGGTLSSADGDNWSPVADSGYYSLAIEATTTNVYYGGLNHLFKSDASAGTVTDIYPNLTLATGDETVFINDFTIVSENEVYVVTSTNGIYLTEDQGGVFVKLESGAPSGGNDMIVINDDVRMVLGTSAKSLVTRDDGFTWEDCYPGATCYEIGGILNDSIIGMGKSNIYKVAVSDVIAGNYTWASQDISDGNNMQKMHIIDDTHAIIVGYGQTLVSTDDAGLSWSEIETPELFVYGADYDFSSVSTVGEASYASTSRFYMIDLPSDSEYSDVYASGLIYKSMDYWKTWERLDIANIGTGDDPALNPNAEGAFGISPEKITCVNDSTVYVFARWIDSIAGYNESRVYHANVFKTDNSGDTWTSLFDDLGSTYITSIDFEDKDNGYITGNTFLRKTSDGCVSFTDMYPALQTTASPNDSTVFIKELDIIDENKWYVLTSTNGLIATEDGGLNYSIVPVIAGGNGLMSLDETTLIVLGMSTKSKISWDLGEAWNECYPGSTIWEIGGVLNEELIGLAKGSIYKIPLADLEAPSVEADILSFVLNEQTAEATINTENNTITIEVATGTDPSALTPTITISEGAEISPASEIEQDFSDTVSYTVTAEDMQTDEVWTVTVTIQVGVEGMTEKHIILYPNPVNDKLYLENIETVERISIFSITGSLMLDMETPSSSAEINISELEEGVYFISFTDVEGGVSTKKVVKK